MKEYFSLTEGIFNCLVDSERNEVFREAIRATVRPGDVVADFGGGSGILSLFALESGAARVYCVESDYRAALHLPEIFRCAGFGDRVTILSQDARRVVLPEKADVIICEMIATGLIEELQVPVMNRAHRFAADGVRVVLERYDCLVDLVNNPEQISGYRFPLVRYEYKDRPEMASTVLSPPLIYATVDFSRPVRGLRVDKEVTLVASSEGIVNGVRISGLTHFHGGAMLADTFAYSYPVILPVMDTVKVKKGDQLNLRLSYSLCKGFGSLSYFLEKMRCR